MQNRKHIIEVKRSCQTKTTSKQKGR